MRLNLSRVSVVSSLFLLALAMPAQQPAQSSELQITGRVIRAENGAPIQGAKAGLWLPYIAGVAAPRMTSITDANGEYSFQGIPDGTYLIQASAEGFVGEGYRSNATPEGAFVRVNASTRITGADIQLFREAIIHGVILEVDGKPAGPGVAVDAVGQTLNLHSRGAQGTTDADGHFVLKGLLPGSYFICVNWPYTQRARPNAQGGWYQETWYGDKPTSKDALQMPLKEGEERDDIRITVKREKQFNVIVWMNGPQGVPAPEHFEAVVRRDAASIGSEKQDDGSYLIRNIPPGHYTLYTAAWSGRSMVMPPSIGSNISMPGEGAISLGQSQTEFDVADTDITLHVNVLAYGAIQGVAKWEGEPPATPPRFFLELQSADGAPAVGSQGGSIAPDGSFSFQRVRPGRYTFHLIGRNSLSVRCNDVEVTKATPLQVGDGQQVTGCEATLKRTQN